MSDPDGRQWRFYIDDMIAFAIVASDVPALLSRLRSVDAQST